ncbi:MAG: SRPBCC domain-containing protein [bacterium]
MRFQPQADACVIIERVIPAPRALVFAAWTDARHLVRWFAPEGFSVAECVADARPGGRLRIVMRAPDGTEFPMVGTFTEVSAPARLVFIDDVSEHPPQWFEWFNPLLEKHRAVGDTCRSELTVDLTEVEGGTQLTLTTRYASTAIRDAYSELGHEQGMGKVLDRLVGLASGFAPSPEADRELVLTRLVRAPRAVVWKSLTDPVHLDRWWGPAGFKNTTHAFDLRVGGQWRYTMHGPDGTDYPNLVTWKIIEPEARLVYDHGDSVERPRWFVTTLTLATEGDATRVTLRSLFDTPEACAATLEYHAVEGGFGTLRKLDAFAQHLTDRVLQVTLPTDTTIHFTRLFDAPRTLVWAAITETAHLARWWGQDAAPLIECEVDFRPGGAWRFVQRDDDGTRYAFHGVYREVVPGERMVHTFIFEPMPEHEVVVTTELVDVEGGATRLIATMAHASQAARDGHVQSGMEAGAAESYDRLARLLATLQA